MASWYYYDMQYRRWILSVSTHRVKINNLVEDVRCASATLVERGLQDEVGAVRAGFAGVVQQRELGAGVAAGLEQRSFVRAEQHWAPAERQPSTLPDCCKGSSLY